MRFKVLIVEDSKATREFLATAVEEVDGVDVVLASGGYEALKMLPRHSYDLIITDINMPDINGLEIVNFVRHDPRFAEVPLFIVSTESAQTDRDRGMALGADEYLCKPFPAEDLIDLVRRYLLSDAIP